MGPGSQRCNAGISLFHLLDRRRPKNIRSIAIPFCVFSIILVEMNTPYEADRRAFIRKAIASTVVLGASYAGRPVMSAQTSPAREKAKGVRLNVHDFGAAGDGRQLDMASLQSALDRCYVLGGGEVIVPAGRYLTGSLALRSNTTLRLEKDAVIVGSEDLKHYSVAQVRWEGKWIPGYNALLHAVDATNIAIIGEGRIEGCPAVAGRPTKEDPLRRPALIEAIGCTHVQFDGFSTNYEHMWSIHPTLSDNVHIRNLTIRSTGGNGDGIDVDSCRHVVIEGCDIASGDDCISLKSGRGEEAYQLNRPTEDVHISNCTFEGRGYACIGIGSETSAGIHRVVIEHCRIRSAYTHAFYIKSRIGRGASIENVTVRDIDAENMRLGFLRINQTHSGLQDQNPVPGMEGVPLFRNLQFEEIRVKDAPVLVDATETYANKPVDGFVLKNISGTCAKGILLANVRNVDIRDILVQGFAGPLLSIANATGKGLEGAGKLAETAMPELVPETAAYSLH